MKTVTTDILVIGDGLAGAWAAIKTKELGRDVVLIDKGKVGRSGSSVW
jgi:succinate dehydrogenase/fumarate reductase flavoprotein subunit